MISDALKIYMEEHGANVVAFDRISYAIDALLPFWGRLTVASVKGATCRRYAQYRGKADATVRRELGTLRAAINHCEREGYLLGAPPVTLPPKPAPKQRWLTRSEAARLLWAAHRLGRGKHLARFILIGLYTGTRKEAILALRFGPHTQGGWIDLENGLMYRRADDAQQTKKLQPPARLPNRLMAHVRRWKGQGTWVVEYQGGRCGDIKKAWHAARIAAGLDNAVVPHSLRHTAITWAMQRGARTWDAASFFGVSAEVIERVYGHHSADHQSTAKDAMDRRR